MASSEKLYTRSQVLEAFRLMVAFGKLAFCDVRELDDDMLLVLGLEPVGKKFRRVAGASVDTAGSARVSDGFGSVNRG